MRIGRVRTQDIPPEALALLVILEEHTDHIGPWALCLSAQFSRVATDGEIPWYAVKWESGCDISFSRCR